MRDDVCHPSGSPAAPAVDEMSHGEEELGHGEDVKDEEDDVCTDEDVCDDDEDDDEGHSVVVLPSRIPSVTFLAAGAESQISYSLQGPTSSHYADKTTHTHTYTQTEMILI